MGSLKKPLLLLGFAVAVSYAGFKLYLYHQVKQAVDNMVFALSPYAHVQYGGITSGVDGTLGVEKLRVEPRGVADVMTIDSVEIKTPGLMFLLRGWKVQETRELPESLSLIVRGAELGTDGALMRAMFGAMGDDAAGVLHHCGEHRALGIAELRKLGYHAVRMDARVGYEYVGARNRSFAEWTVHDMWNMKLDMEATGVSRRLFEMDDADAYLASVSLSYRDLALTQRVTAMCAEAAGVNAEQYIEAQLALDDAGFQRAWGFVPGPGMREAYRRFLVQPGEIRVQVRPDKDTNFEGLRFYKAQDAFEMLNPLVSVNGEVVSDLSFQHKPQLAARAAAPVPAAAPRPRPAEADAAADADAPSGTEPPPQRLAAVASKPSRSGYAPVAPAELARHLGRKVRLHVGGGLVREGKLVDLQNGVAIVERRYDGALITLKVRLVEIERAEAYF
ncbi:MAG TPA: hypothetical protein VGA00_13670 [Acidiferrobacterales bacterium]